MEEAQQAVVTTSNRARDDVQAYAEERAAAWGMPYLERFERPLPQVIGEAEAAFVFGNDGLVLSIGDERLRFTPGTAAMRIRTLDQGRGDPLQRAGQLQPGDTVLDCTMGLARDSLVAAHLVGPSGDVLGLESNRIMHCFVSEGLAAHDPGSCSATVRTAFDDSRQFLARAEPGSFDVVVLDPMFPSPKRSDNIFRLLRAHTDDTSIDRAWIRQARRVARRCVVLKVALDESWFEAEELVRVSASSAIHWFSAPALAR